MSKVYVIRYGFQYEHSNILGVYEDKSEAKTVLNKFLEDHQGFNDCYIEKFELIKKKKPDGKNKTPNH